MIQIYNNPKGEAYHKLLDYAAKHSPLFVLAVRQQLAHNGSHYEVLEKLAPYLVKKVRTDNSLQHQLSIAYSPNDWLYFYACHEASIAILKSFSNSLLDWQHPRLPEDLCFLDHEEQDWLITIAHEGIMRLLVTEDEAERLSAEIQGLFLKGQFNQELDKLLADAEWHQAEYLDISGYGIKTIPEQLCRVRSLKSLKLFEQYIDHLPDRFFDLTRLESITLWTTNMHNLPSAIQRLQRLKHLAIYCGCYHDTPETGVIIRKEEVHFNELPTEIGELQSLESLDIQYTALRGLPETLKRLKNLRHLNLTNNMIQAKPPVLDEMIYLETCMLMKNDG
ncbi:leucine-rich repeat domain-containing protein [Xylanibacillus composti]|uniref:Leucine-rich repeat domain-containing protein n=1 Tax=Xylanibacillus composti TaxID=1572762 RepID=A0A8J4H6U5_9BACL|nr:leucine-rich repeat domain-containing protein [Xylanibacillus composti]MDT9726615.1 leucine-rich repeat domain-containing protein [Xylanibacillus composti]GIQ70825.1 hypothetical protein XYCOK13_36490 [Xylanibacillus composti]